MQFYEFKETQERVILIGVQTEVGDDVEASLDELEELAETAGAETVAKVIQNRPISAKARLKKWHPFYALWMPMESSVMMNFLRHS